MPELYLTRYRVENFKFSFKDAKRMLLDFKVIPILNFQNDYCELKMEIQIVGKEDKKTPFKLSLYILGQFTGENATREEIEELCKTKGSYELIQVARSIVLSFTAQAGISPAIIIPPINLEDLFEEE